MWTTSSSLAEARVLALVAAAWAVPPDAPRPAPSAPKEPAVPSLHEVKRPVELRSVAAGPLTEAMRQQAGAEFLKAARDPIYVEVKTLPGILGRPAFAAAPLIVLNGERLLSTRWPGPDTLVAFLPDRGALKDENAVAVVWVGKQEPTLTRKPLTLLRADVEPGPRVPR